MPRVRNWWVAGLFWLGWGCGDVPERTTGRPFSDTLGTRITHAISLVYHRFNEPQYPSTSVSMELFRKHISYLKEAEFQFLTASAALKARQDTLKRVAVLTVDDGYASFYQTAFPFIKQAGIPIAVYVNTASVGKPGYMDWQELEEITQYGVEIGNHSHTHEHLLSQTLQQFEQELDTSEALFKSRLGIVPATYAYPYGEYRTQHAEILRERGYAGALAQYSGLWHPGSPRYGLPRFPMAGPYAALPSFKEKVRSRPLIPQGNTDGPAVLRADSAFQWCIQFRNQAALQWKRLQVFDRGVPLASEQVELKNKGCCILLDDEVNSRRRLVTITAPDREGQWHWFSKLFVYPSMPE